MPDPLKVALSVDALGPRLTGIGRYCLELAERMPGAIGAGNISYFRGDHWIDDPHDLLEEDWHPARRNPWLRRYKTWARARRLSDTVVHAPNYFLPPWAERGVATIHDLSVFKYPETHPLERIKAFEAHFQSTIARASLILTDCEWVRRELIEFTGIAPHRVAAVPLGVGQEFRPRALEEVHEFALRNALEPGRYGLCVSTMEPRKRINLLVDAWRSLPLTLRTSYPLVLAGGAGWLNESLLLAIERGQAEGWIRYLGYVDEAELPLLYAGARVFAYPSQYEGFGFPPLEAMASGVPTVVAAGTCLEETAGAAAALITPEDNGKFTELLVEILTDEQRHHELTLAGIQHARQYSWTRCVEGTVDAYRTILQG